MATSRPATPASTDGWGPLPPHADPKRPSRVLRFLEGFLAGIGLGCLGWYLYVQAESALYQAFETRELDEILATAPPPAPEASVSTPGAAGTTGRAPATTPPAATARAAPVPVTPTRPRPEPANGTTLGRLEIPRLGVSAIVRAGSDARTLRLAIGHIGGTALPGETGNIGLAAHRDTFFRRLGEIRAKDLVRLVTRDGTFTYHVQGTRVVEPRDTWVIGPTTESVLTLITCYPFRYVGSAPQRFIVRATLGSG